MKILISWSGERSKYIARAVAKWLEEVFLQDVKTWMSDHSIHAGDRWGDKLNVELETSSFGIICLAPENLNAPWILFEAGALSKMIESSRVVPYLFDLKPTDVSGPLVQFQSVLADKGGTFEGGNR